MASRSGAAALLLGRVGQELEGEGAQVLWPLLVERLTEDCRNGVRSFP